VVSHATSTTVVATATPIGTFPATTTEYARTTRTTPPAVTARAAHRLERVTRRHALNQPRDEIDEGSEEDADQYVPPDEDGVPDDQGTEDDTDSRPVRGGHRSGPTGPL
jgi:hypothetical protein